MPDITTYTSPLMGCVQNNKPFLWTPLLNKCFKSIKANHPDPICGSKSGVSAVYGQGMEWQTCHPTGFLSKKFSAAQQNYQTHEHETIAILEALIRWEDKLLGLKFVIVTDHKSLEYFETQPSLSSRQTRWWEYLSRFNFTVKHVAGPTNRVADCLSRYYETDGPDEQHPAHEFVSVDAQLDPDGETLPAQRYVELRSAAARQSRRLAERVKQRIVDSEQMNERALDVPS